MSVESRPQGAALEVASLAGGSATNHTEAGLSWTPVSLAAVVQGLQNGTLETPRPTVGRLADGGFWLYAGRTNSVAGESGSGKTWAALAAAKSELDDGHPVIMADYEDNEIGVVGRLLAMGVAPDVLADPSRFAYIHPDVSIAFGEETIQRLLDIMKPTLFIIDSTGESMALENCDPNSDDQVARWFQRFPTWVASRGPAVLLLDHLPKASAGAASPIGSQRKRAALSGVQFIQDVRKGMSFAKGTPGEAVLTCTKDRSGHFVTGTTALKLIVNINASRPDGVDVALTTNGGAWAPTKTMAQISAFMETQHGALVPTKDIAKAVGGNAKARGQALRVLVHSGYLTLSKAGQAHLYAFVRQFKNGDAYTLPADFEDAADDDDGAPKGRSARQANCTQHEYHEGEPCNPEWCHPGHHGDCNNK